MGLLDPKIDKDRTFEILRGMGATKATLEFSGGRGKTFARYTVFLYDENADYEYALGIGPTGNVANGFCMTVDAVQGPHLGEEIDLEQMTEAARRAVEDELRSMTGAILPHHHS